MLVPPTKYVGLLLLILSYILFSKAAIEVIVDLPFLNPCCWGVSSSLCSKNSDKRLKIIRSKIFPGRGRSMI